MNTLTRGGAARDRAQARSSSGNRAAPQRFQS
jgi:hypothetical protein